MRTRMGQYTGEINKGAFKFTGIEEIKCPHCSKIAYIDLEDINPITYPDTTKRALNFVCHACKGKFGMPYTLISVDVTIQYDEKTIKL